MIVNVDSLISVVIPTANRGELLARAIRSVLAQTYRNLEVIVVDDASTDNTAQVMEEFAGQVSYLRQEQKAGGSAARNRGIEASSGSLVAFLDDDDEWLPEKLALQVAAAQQTVDGCTPVVYTGEEWIDTEGETVRVVRPKRQGWLLRDLLYGNYVGSTSTVLATKEALNEVDGFDATLPSCQDWDLWVRLAERYPFRVLPEPLVRRSVHGKRIDSNLAGQLRGREQFLQKIQPHLAKESWRYRRQVYSNHAILVAGRYAAGQQRQAAIAWSWRACVQNPLNLRAWYLFVRILAGR